MSIEIRVHYPAHITPGADEPVPSMIARLADTLRVPTTEIFDHPLEPLWHSQPPRGGPQATLPSRVRQWWTSWAAASELLDLSVDYLHRRHTVDGVLGRALEAPLADRWRRHLICPSCNAGTIWHPLPLVTHCETCQLLLTLDGECTTASAGAINIQRTQKADRWTTFYDPNRLRRVRQLLSDLAEVGWFDPPGEPWSPVWVNHLADTAWAASRTPESARENTLSGLYERAGLAGFTSLAENRDALHAELRQADLRPCHVPEALPDTLHTVATIETSFASRATSVALCREVIHARSRYGQRPALHELAHPVGLTATAYDLAEDLGATLPGLRYLRHRARELIDAGLTDYLALERLLASLRTVPSNVLAYAGLTDADAQPAAWWIRTIRTRAYISPRAGAHTEQLFALDKVLTPEARLVLLEYAADHLATVRTDTDSAHTHPAPRLDEQQAIADAG